MLRQFVGRGQAGWAGADDHNLMLLWRSWGHMCCAFGRSLRHGGGVVPHAGTSSAGDPVVAAPAAKMSSNKLGRVLSPLLVVAPALAAGQNRAIACALVGHVPHCWKWFNTPVS